MAISGWGVLKCFNVGGREWVEEDVAAIQCRLDGGFFTAAELMKNLSLPEGR